MTELRPDMHEDNYKFEIRKKLDKALSRAGLEESFHTVSEEGYSDIVVIEVARPRLVLEVKKTWKEVIRTKWWDRTRGRANEKRAAYFGITNGEMLILFKDRPGARVGHCMLKPGPIVVGAYGPNGEADEVLEKFEEEFVEIFRGLFVEKMEYPFENAISTLLHEYKPFHEELAGELRKKLNSQLRANGAFKRRFLAWAGSFSNAPDDRKNVDIVAEECAHLLLTRILFYEILRNELNELDDEIKRQRGIPQITLQSLQNLEPPLPLEAVLSELNKLYEKVLRIDYEQVFSTMGGLLDEIQLSQNAILIIQEFIKVLNDYTITRDEFGEPRQLFSEMFKALIPPEKKHDYGQILTEDMLVDVLCALCMKNHDSTILDPACGTGSFLDAAYKKIQQASRHIGEPKTHPQILEQLHGVDIGKFPLHLCAMRLALNDITYPTNADLRNVSFFNLHPNDFKNGGLADVVLCNPPYLRYDAMSAQEKRQIQAKIRDVTGHLYSPPTSDKYFYFVEYATPFLKEGGWAGWVLSDKFLVTKTGQSLKKFLLANYEVKAFVKFAHRSFPDAMVDVCLVILRKPRNAREKQQNKTIFLKVKQLMKIDRIEREIQSMQSGSSAVRRVEARPQAELDPHEKWHEYFLDLSILNKIKSAKRVILLAGISKTIERGKDNGCSEFFFPSKYLGSFDISDFLVEGLERSREIGTLILKPADCEKLLLILPNTDLNDPSNRGLREFINFASSRAFDPDYKDRVTKRYAPVPQRKIVSSNSKRSGRPWYSFDPGGNDYDIIIPRSVRTYFKVLVSEANPYISTNFWGIRLERLQENEKLHELNKYFIAAFLNSSLSELQFEVEARKYVGLAKMEGPDIKKLVVMDPRSVSAGNKENVVRIFRQLSANFGTDGGRVYKEMLDRKLLELLGLPGIYDELIDTLEELKSARKASYER